MRFRSGDDGIVPIRLTARPGALASSPNGERAK